MSKKSKKIPLLCPPKLPIAVDFIEVLEMCTDCEWQCRKGEIEPPEKEDPDKAILIIKNHSKTEYQYIEKLRKIRSHDDWKTLQLWGTDKSRNLHMELAKTVNLVSPLGDYYYNDNVCWVCSLIKALRYYYLYGLHDYFGFDPQVINNRDKKGISFYFRPIPPLLKKDDIGRWICVDFVTVHEKLRSLERKSSKIYSVPKRFLKKREQIIYALSGVNKLKRGTPRTHAPEDIGFCAAIYEKALANGYSRSEIIKKLGNPSGITEKQLDIARKYTNAQLKSFARKFARETGISINDAYQRFIEGKW